MKKKKSKHQHRWEYSGDFCPRCSYSERYCKAKDCTVCQALNDKNKWETVSE